MLLFSKDFWNFNNQLGVIFSRWYSRLTRVLFNCNARVRPSIIGYRIWCCGAQETSWMTIRTSVLVYIYFVVLSNCVSSCMLLMLNYDWCTLMMYSVNILYKQIYFSVWVKICFVYIIFYSAAMWDSDVVFCFFFFYLFFLNKMVRFYGSGKSGCYRELL